MSPLAWVVVAYLATTQAAGVTKAVLNFRTAKRRDQAKAVSHAS